MTQEEKINKIVELIHQDLENHLQEYDIDYTEDLHEAIKNRFDDIAETQYRKSFGKLW